MSDFPELRAKLKELEATNQELRAENMQQAGRIQKAQGAFRDLLPKIGVRGQYAKRLQEMDVVDAVADIAKRGGEFRPVLEMTPEREPLTDEQKAARTINARRYM